jgi:hypothetical protein
MHRTARPLGLLAALAAGLATLTACGTSPAGPASPAALASAKTAALALPKGVKNATAVPGKVPNDAALRKTVVIASCAQISGGWRASGTATNSTSKAVDYTVTVFFTTPRDTVIGTGDTRVHVAPDSSTQWTAAGKFTAAPSTRCVLRGVG